MGEGAFAGVREWERWIAAGLEGAGDPVCVCVCVCVYMCVYACMN